MTTKEKVLELFELSRDVYLPSDGLCGTIANRGFIIGKHVAQ